MARKRTTVAQKRIQKTAAIKNVAFLVDIIPELKEAESMMALDKKKSKAETQNKASGSYKSGSNASLGNNDVNVREPPAKTPEMKKSKTKIQSQTSNSAKSGSNVVSGNNDVNVREPPAKAPDKKKSKAEIQNQASGSAKFGFNVGSSNNDVNVPEPAATVKSKVKMQHQVSGGKSSFYSGSDNNDSDVREPPAKKKPRVENQHQEHGSVDFRSNVSTDGNDVEVQEPLLFELSSTPPMPSYRRKSSVEELIEDWETESNSHQQISTPNKHTNEASRPVEGGECSCGMAEEVSKLKAMVESLKNDLSQEVIKNQKLADDNSTFEKQNAKLQQALTSKLLPEPEMPFKVCEEFIDANTLRKFSIEAESDYVFMKFLMMRLWPDGLIGRSLTGRQSNNPSGRPISSKANETIEECESESIDLGASSEGTSNGTVRGEIADGTSHVKHALEKEKVDYCIRCLYERRLFLRDDMFTANVRAKKGRSLMTRVIANASRP